VLLRTPETTPNSSPLLATTRLPSSDPSMGSRDFMGLGSPGALPGAELAVGSLVALLALGVLEAGLLATAARPALLAGRLLAVATELAPLSVLLALLPHPGLLLAPLADLAPLLAVLVALLTAGLLAGTLALLPPLLADLGALLATLAVPRFALPAGVLAGLLASPTVLTPLLSLLVALAGGLAVLLTLLLADPGTLAGLS